MLLPSQASVHTHAGGMPCKYSRTSEYVHYMAHIENAARIIKWGLFAHKWASSLPGRRDIADKDVMGNREEFWGYVNLYFGTHTAMQWVLDIEEEDLVFIRFRSDEIFREPGVRFSDGNAASRYTRTYDASSQSEQLSTLDWSSILCVKKHYEYAKRPKMAELLVPNYIPPSMIDSAVVLNQRAERRLRALLASPLPKGYLDAAGKIFDEFSSYGIDSPSPGFFNSSTDECKIIRDRKGAHFFSHGDGVEPNIELNY